MVARSKTKAPYLGYRDIYVPHTGQVVIAPQKPVPVRKHFQDSIRFPAFTGCQHFLDSLVGLVVGYILVCLLRVFWRVSLVCRHIHLVWCRSGRAPLVITGAARFWSCLYFLFIAAKVHPKRLFSFRFAPFFPLGSRAVLLACILGCLRFGAFLGAFRLLLL